jgi:hypothetical protein
MWTWYPNEATLVSLGVLVPYFDTPCNKRSLGLRRRQDSSVSIVMCYELGGRGDGFFSSSQLSERLCGLPSLLSNAYRRLFSGGVKPTTYLHLVLRSVKVEMYLLSPTRCSGVVLN